MLSCYDIAINVLSYYSVVVLPCYCVTLFLPLAVFSLGFFGNQVVTSYDDHDLDMVLEACEGMTNHLTAAVVSNDSKFQAKVLGHTVNGTTYCGIRAR